MPFMTLPTRFYKQGQSDSAEVYLKPVAQISQRIKYRVGLGDYNRLRGVIQMHRGQYEDALMYYQNAITEYTKADKPRGVAQVYNNMGWLYKMMGDSQHVLSLTKQGLQYIERAIAINQRLGVSSLLVDNYINAGIIYEDMAEYDPHGNTEKYQLGRALFFKAIAINDKLHAGPEAYRVPYNNLGKKLPYDGAVPAGRQLPPERIGHKPVPEKTQQFSPQLPQLGQCLPGP